MKWIEAQHLVSWADRLDARTRLAEVVYRLVWGSAANISFIRFPIGENAQTPGYDGRLKAIPLEEYKAFLPEGDSVWEFGVGANYLAKANEDYTKRTMTPGDAIDPAQTTFVFVTPQKWVSTKPSLEGWAIQKIAEKRWKDVRVLDSMQLEHWLELRPAVSASVAREIVRNLPQTGALSTDELWQEYSAQFEPPLREEVLLAGRGEQAKLMIRSLTGNVQVHRWQGDSLAEVLAFAVACIRKADPETRAYLEARTLIIESTEAARQLAHSPNLIFAVTAESTSMAGRLAENHPVIVPVGRDRPNEVVATRLTRPSAVEMAEALKTMGFTENQALRKARECDRSTTILARRISSSLAKLPKWHNDGTLVPALIAGSWDAESPHDREILSLLAGGEEYSVYEARLREFLKSEDGPVERVGSVWAIRAPVDVFSYLGPLFGTEHLKRLDEAARIVFGEIDPGLALEPENRPFAQLYGADRKYTGWLRDGLANSLLMLAVLGDKSGAQFIGGSAQKLVNEIIQKIPALREDPRIIASLRDELPLLMEAAPDPLLAALEHLLGGGRVEMRSVFQDSSNRSAIFAQSPHTGLLFALEMIAWDPAFFARAALVLARLAKIDPGGSLSNRPLRSLRHIFLAWKPATNASLAQRLSTLDEILESEPTVSWQLLLLLLPKRPDFGDGGISPRFREAGASEKETLTNKAIFETYQEIIRRVVSLAGTIPERWAAILDQLHSFPENERGPVIDTLEQVAKQMTREYQTSLWQIVNRLYRHHLAHAGKDWALRPPEMERLEALLKNLAPNDPVSESLWLFQHHSEIPYTTPEKFEEELEKLRRAAVAKVWTSLGIPGALKLASSVEVPGFVGFSLGHVLSTPEEGFEVVLATSKLERDLPNFVTLLSLALFDRFDQTWKLTIAARYRSGFVTAEQVAVLTTAWPHNRSTWSYVDSLGPEVSDEFWASRPPWGLQGGSEELEFAVGRYLAAHRAELVVAGLYPRMVDVSSSLILKTLDQLQERIRTTPQILRRQAFDFELQQVFGVLEKRTDVSLAEIAKREYSYLPLLRSNYTAPMGARRLILDRFMAQDAAFYVRILCDVFRPASSRDEDLQLTEEQQARAQFGWTLLDEFFEIPGFDSDPVKKDALQSWVAEVRKLASEQDRLAVAEQKIGKLLAHAPNDPIDDLWPHAAIRESLEVWRSEQIELGIMTERFNMRGGGARDPKAGGKPEHELAEEIRQKADVLRRWPRTQSMLRKLAANWEELAAAIDLQTQQRELKDI